jgi:hypothetical protein
MKEKNSTMELQKNWSKLLSDCINLTSYLREHSYLPSPRANLTLAFTLGELFLGSWKEHKEILNHCLDKWAKSKDEYLLLCRNIVISYLLSEEDSKLFTEILYEQNFNPLWRPREAVTLGLQRTLVKRPDFVLNLLEKWNNSDEPIVLRNTLMILAEPKSLQCKPEIRDILREYIHQAMNLVVEEVENKKGDIKLLQKSLRFVPSVAAIYDEKIVSDLIEWVDSDSKTLKSIVKSNMRKKRFIKLYPEISKKILELC